MPEVEAWECEIVNTPFIRWTDTKDQSRKFPIEVKCVRTTKPLDTSNKQWYEWWKVMRRFPIEL